MKEEKVYFKNRKGDKLCGILTIPENTSKKYPLVILCHGFTSSKDSASYTFMEEKLYKAGKLSLRFDFYGHGESAGKLEDITITEGVEDVLCAIDFVKGLKYIGNIALFGTSFGGLCVLLATSRSTGIVALGMKSLSPDMKENRKQRLGDEGFREWRQKGHAFFTNNDGKKVRLNYSLIEDAERIDAFEEAKRITCPVLIIQGDKDASVPLAQSERVAKNIKNAKFEVVKGANHYFDRLEEMEKINSRFVDFFKEVIK